MKKTFLIIFFLNIVCVNNSNNKVHTYLTNGKSQNWELIFEKQIPNSDWKTIWRFSDNGDYYQFYYNNLTYEVELKSNEDNIEINKFSCEAKDTLILNESPFPIINIDNNSLKLKNIYGVDYHPEDTISLKRLDLKSSNALHRSILNKIDSILGNGTD